MLPLLLWLAGHMQPRGCWQYTPTPLGGRYAGARIWVSPCEHAPHLDCRRRRSLQSSLHALLSMTGARILSKLLCVRLLHAPAAAAGLLKHWFQKVIQNVIKKVDQKVELGVVVQGEGSWRWWSMQVLLARLPSGASLPQQTMWTVCWRAVNLPRVPSSWSGHCRCSTPASGPWTHACLPGAAALPFVASEKPMLPVETRCPIASESACRA